MTVGIALDGGRVGAEKLTAPPFPSDVLFRHRGEPVLPENGTNVPRWGAGERVSGEELENYLLSNDLVKPTDAAAGLATNAGCSDEEHAKMATKTIRFF